jgi:hypothetical protein
MAEDIKNEKPEGITVEYWADFGATVSKLMSGNQPDFAFLMASRPGRTVSIGRKLRPMCWRSLLHWNTRPTSCGNTARTWGRIRPASRIELSKNWHSRSHCAAAIGEVELVRCENLSNLAKHDHDQ